MALRARAGRPILGRWTPGEVLQQAQQAVEDGLPGGGVGVTNLGGGLLHSSCWCARYYMYSADRGYREASFPPVITVALVLGGT